MNKELSWHHNKIAIVNGQKPSHNYKLCVWKYQLPGA